MTSIKNAPNQPFVDTKAAFDWELEETLVERRRKLPYRIRRIIRSWWFWVALMALLVSALFDAELMRGILSLLMAVVTILFAASYIIFQFLIMFWFVSRTRQYEIMPGAEGIGFKDYRGQPEILEQAQQIVTLLRGVTPFEDAGGEPLNGLLLEGPPGTGKTWLAQAISTEAGVPFYYVDTSSLQAMFMGVGNLKVGRMYAKARKAAKDYGAAVIFLDEIDSIGSRGGVAAVGGGQTGGMMGGMMGGGSMGLLSTMLIEMSGFSLEHGWRARLNKWFYRTLLRREQPKPHKRVLTIGATNRIQALDPALLRPGRFDKKIRIDAPDAQGRRDIFAYYLSKMAHDESMEAALLASECPGYTPADIKYLLNETLRYALFDGRRYMSYADFQRAKPEHEMGLRAPIKNMSHEARERLAFHEAGHAVAVRLFLPDHRIARVTIIRQGGAYGHVSHYPAHEAYQGMRTRDQYFDLLRVYVAGKASEVEFCGLPNQTLGVGGDFQQIRFWLNMMARAGMLGPLGGAMGVRLTLAGTMFDMPPEMAQAMEDTFQQVLNDTRRALREHAEMVRALVALLMEREELLAADVKAFFDQYGLPTPEMAQMDEAEPTVALPEGDAAVAAPGTAAV